MKIVIIFVVTIGMASVFGQRQPRQAGNVIYPTDCPPGENCFAEVLQKSTNLVDFFKNVRDKFPWAEVELTLNNNDDCSQCTLDSSVDATNSELLENDGCKAAFVTCPGTQRIRNTDVTNGLLKCMTGNKWYVSLPTTQNTPLSGTICN